MSCSVDFETNPSGHLTVEGKKQSVWFYLVVQDRAPEAAHSVIIRLDDNKTHARLIVDINSDRL